MSDDKLTRSLYSVAAAVPNDADNKNGKNKPNAGKGEGTKENKPTKEN